MPAQDDPVHTDRGAEAAGRNDSGREAQPPDRESVERSAGTAERLDRQRRGFDDAAGINPDRKQDATPEPGDAGPDEG